MIKLVIKMILNREKDNNIMLILKFLESKINILREVAVNQN